MFIILVVFVNSTQSKGCLTTIDNLRLSKVAFLFRWDGSKLTKKEIWGEVGSGLAVSARRGI
jgi:hypothetical protein